MSELQAKGKTRTETKITAENRNRRRGMVEGAEKLRRIGLKIEANEFLLRIKS